MKPLSPKTKQKFKKQLLEEEEKLVKQLKSFAVEDKGDQGGFRSKIGEDDMGRSDEDNATDFSTMTNKRSAEDILEKRLKEIRGALERIEMEDYGLCEECGKEIKIERLTHNPSTQLCINCANQKSI